MTNETIKNTSSLQEKQSDVNFSDIWNIIWGYKWWYTIIVSLCLLGAVFYLYKTPRIYNRSAKIIIDENSQSATMRDIMDISGLGTDVSSVNVNNEVEALSSPDLMKKVVERLRLEIQYTEQQPLRKRELYNNSPIAVSFSKQLTFSSLSFTINKDNDSTFTLENFTINNQKIKCSPIPGGFNHEIETPLGIILVLPSTNFTTWNNRVIVQWENSYKRAKQYSNKLKASIDGKLTSIVTLSIDDTYPTRAENILNTLIDVYNEEWVHDKNRAARKTSEFINERLSVIEHELGGIETDLKDYKEKNKLTDIQAISQSYLDESSQYATKSFEVNNQLAIAQYIRDYLMEPTNETALIPANSGLSSADIESQIGEYNQLVLQRDKLLTTSSEKNPLIADINAAMLSIKSAIIRSLDNLIATLRLQADKIKSQEDQIMSRIASSSGQQMELLSIERQQKVKESLYIYLLQKREENEITSLVNIANTRLIVSPTGQNAPIFPNTKMIILLAIAIGFGLPFGIIILTKITDTTVKNKNDLSLLSIPFLSEIPQLQSSLKRNLVNIGRHKFDNSNCRIMVKKGSRDVINEAFRVLRTNLDIMLGKDQLSQAIMITSFNPNAGKTFVTMNIAYSMALKGQKVLLLDLDLRKATLSKSLNRNHEGIVSFLIGKHNNIDALVQNIEENLDLISVGTIPPNPSELLLGKRFTEILNILKSKYQYIFIDCPPIDIVADTSIIAQSTDVSIFVIRAGIMDKRSLTAVEDLYNENKYKRMAIILNGVSKMVGSYGKYGYRYGYGYGYGNKEDK